MSQKFNKLFVQIDCRAFLGKKKGSDEDRFLTEGVYAFFMDVQPPNFQAPTNVVLHEIFDEAAKYRFYLNPALKRRKVLPSKPWVEYTFSSAHLNAWTRSELYSDVSRLINSRFDSLVHHCAVMSSDSSRELHNEFVGKPLSVSPKEMLKWELVPYSSVDVNTGMPIIAEEEPVHPKRAAWLSNPTYIKESVDFLSGGTVQVTLVHCNSINDVLVAYLRYSSHTSLGKSL